MRKAEEDRRKVTMHVELSARNPGCSATITHYVKVVMDEDDSFGNLRDKAIAEAIANFRANLEVVADVQGVEFRE